MIKRIEYSYPHSIVLQVVLTSKTILVAYKNIKENLKNNRMANLIKIFCISKNNLELFKI